MHQNKIDYIKFLFNDLFYVFIIYIYCCYYYYYIYSEDNINKSNKCNKNISSINFNYYILPQLIEYKIINRFKSRCRYNTSIVISVLSNPINFKKRQSFRINYRKYKISNFCKLIFFIAISNKNISHYLNKEIAMYNDIVQFSFLNSYYNLTLLSIMALKFSFRLFTNLLYYIKTDDDILINHNLLLKVINCIDPTKSRVYGHLGGRYRVQRDVKCKNYLPHSSYPYEYMPKYVYGGLIIITKYSLRKLYNLTLHRQNYLWREDINLGALCGKVNITVSPFPLKADIILNNKGCNLNNLIIGKEIKTINDTYYCLKVYFN